jgi:hypothetical protein
VKPYKPGDEFDESRGAVEAFARAHGLRVAWHPEHKDNPEYREKILPCAKSARGRGYWWWRGPGAWGFYHPSRRSPDRDFAAVSAIAPGAQDGSTEEETYFFAREEEALKVMRTGPAWCRPMLKRTVVLTPEQAASVAERGRQALARFRSTKIEQSHGLGPDGPTVPWSNGEGPCPQPSPSLPSSPTVGGAVAEPA